MDRQARALGVEMICPRPQGEQVAEQRFKPKFSITTQMVLPKGESKRAPYFIPVHFSHFFLLKKQYKNKFYGFTLDC